MARRRWTTLHSTNNFPEFTGRICPAPCEAACTLNIQDAPVTIKSIECAIVDRGWEEGWIVPQPPARAAPASASPSSAPAPPAWPARQQLARAGHAVTVFEKSDRIGGLLRYGIPDFKMEKHLIDRRVEQMEAEGVEFRTGVEVGADAAVEALLADYDAVVLAGGAEWPRDLEVPGRELDGIHYAMDFLAQQNKRVAGDAEDRAAPRGAHLAPRASMSSSSAAATPAPTASAPRARQGAASVTQIEIMPKPPERENKALSWPNWPTQAAHLAPRSEEGCAARLGGADQARASARPAGSPRSTASRVEWVRGRDGRMQMREVAGSELRRSRPTSCCSPWASSARARRACSSRRGVALDARGNVQADTERLRAPPSDGVFAAGDMRRGQSLVVWAIREGRQCARAVDEFLMGSSDLPR